MGVGFRGMSIHCGVGMGVWWVVLKASWGGVREAGVSQGLVGSGCE